MLKDSSVEIGMTRYYSQLIESAKQNRMWIYGKMMGLEFWFSPREFELKLFDGGDWLIKVKWVLKSPRERVRELKYFIEEMKKEIEDISNKYYEENN